MQSAEVLVIQQKSVRRGRYWAPGAVRKSEERDGRRRHRFLRYTCLSKKGKGCPQEMFFECIGRRCEGHRIRGPQREEDGLEMTCRMVCLRFFKGEKTMKRIT